MVSLEKLSPVNRGTAVNAQYEKWLERVLTFEFSRDRKMMSVLVRRSDGAVSLLVKGAPESVLERSTSVLVRGQIVPLTPQLRQAISQKVSSYARRGLRTLALAYTDKPCPNPVHYKSQSTADYGRFERDLVFVSVVGMLDPPRPEVKGAISKCKTAGIRVICITGDNKDTAEAICRQIGIFQKDEDTTGKSYTGRELDALSHEEKVEAVKRASLFSRTEPGHKSQLVDLLQAEGMVVAMVRLLIFHRSLRLVSYKVQ